MAVSEETLRNPKNRIINGELHIYCEEDGNFYPKFKDSGEGYRLELDEEYFIYIPEGDKPDLSDESVRESYTYMLTPWYGKARQEYLYDHYHEVYVDLVTHNKMHDYLIEIDKQAIQMEESIMAAQMEADGIDEEYKAKDPIGWARLTTGIWHAARYAVQEELIFVPPLGYTEEDADDYEPDEDDLEEWELEEQAWLSAEEQDDEDSYPIHIL